MPDNKVWNRIVVYHTAELKAWQICKLFEELTPEEKAEIVCQLMQEDGALAKFVQDWLGLPE